MSEAMYEALAYAMRYWFIFIMLFILIAVIYVSVKEYRQRKFVMEEIGRYLGYLEIVGGDEEIIGLQYNVASENTIGRSKKSDIYIDDASVNKNHALLYKNKEDFYITAIGKGVVLVNGRKASKDYTLKTGDIITLGEVELKIFIKRSRLGYDY